MSKYAGVAIFHKENILLAKRIEFYKGELCSLPGYWAVFAGSIEDGESPEDAAERELFEESQLTIENPLELIGEIEDFKLFGTNFDDLVYPELNFEHTEYGWFKIDALHSFPYKIDEKLVDLVLKYKNIV
jgi:8-oxo-dGTP pyrophosphatase MutT (NUDIX family)